MNVARFLADRRDGLIHPAEDLQEFCRLIAQGAIPDYQVAAWLMAAFLNPLSDQETVDLTTAMANSGERLDLTGLPRPWVDKHSTGGVGDKTTLVLLPILAACGLTIVKMSGRGLGITGGTVDKLDSIAGFRTDLTPVQLKAQAQEIGLALTGQTPNLAPADKVLYGLRDVTGTVASIPLIVSSILSKKIAGGAENVVFDVKCGSGSFMPTLEAAGELAKALVRVGTQAGLRVSAAITDMSQPLGSAVGNRLEVAEAAQILRANGSPLPLPTRRFRELCLRLAGLTLVNCGVAADPDQGYSRATEALESGRARAKAQAWFVAQGAAEDPFSDEFDPALDAHAVEVQLDPEGGWIKHVDARKVGEVALRLGAGRQTKEASIDPRVGILLHGSVGDPNPHAVATVFAKSKDDAAEAAHEIRAAIEISTDPVETPPLILTVV